MSWDLKFPEPISISGRKPLVIPRHAATYNTTLSATEQQDPPWRNAVHALMEAADHRGPVEFARIGMMQALQPREPVYDTSRKDPVWRNTHKLARGR